MTLNKIYIEKKLLSALILTIIFNLALFSQTPCSGGFAGSYPCKDYDLMSIVSKQTLSGSTTAEGSDVWGWTDPSNGKEYAIAAMTNSTAFVDISDPLNPIFLGRLNTNAGSNFWRDVKVYNNFAFIVADNVGSHGVQVFDLTKLRNVTSPPTTFTADTVYNGVGSCHNIVINEDKAVAYLVGCRANNGGGPIFLDISDPLNPTSLGDYRTAGYSHDAQVITYSGPDSEHVGKEIYIGSNETEVVILDVTNKNNVVELATVDYPQIGYTHQGWFTEDQRYFILGDETDERDLGLNTRTLVFDLSDLDSPRLSSTYTGSTKAIDHNGYVKGNEYFMASYTAGMRVLDITNIAATAGSMSETAFFDTFPSNNATAFNGAWSVYPYFPSGNIIINDINSGLFIVRKSGTLSTNPITKAKNSFIITPNPTSLDPKVISSDKPITSIEVFNILGKRVFQKKNINQKNYTIPLSSQSSGIYIVKINNTIGKKLILR